MPRRFSCIGNDCVIATFSLFGTSYRQLDRNVHAVTSEFHPLHKRDKRSRIFDF
jgi:hypothetical protein